MNDRLNFFREKDEVKIKNKLFFNILEILSANNPFCRVLLLWYYQRGIIRITKFLKVI